MQLKCASWLALVAIFIQAAPGAAKTYRVKNGDTLSSIATQQIGLPVYGHRGSLKKLTDINQHILDKNRIYPKQMIRISKEPEKVQKAVVLARTTAPLAPENRPPNESTDRAAKARFGMKVTGILSKDHMQVQSKDRTFKTNLDSHLNKGLDLQVDYKPTASLRLGLEAAFLDSRYSDSRDAALEGNRHQLKKINLFGEVTLADRWHLGLVLGTEQIFFFTPSSPTSFILEAAFVDMAKASLAYDLIASESWRWGLNIEGASFNKASADGFQIEKGSGYGAGTRLGYQLRAHTSLEGEIFYQRHLQGTEKTKQKIGTSGASIALRFEF